MTHVLNAHFNENDDDLVGTWPVGAGAQSACDDLETELLGSRIQIGAAHIRLNRTTNRIHSLWLMLDTTRIVNIGSFQFLKLIN